MGLHKFQIPINSYINDFKFGIPNQPFCLPPNCEFGMFIRITMITDLNHFAHIPVAINSVFNDFIINHNERKMAKF